MERETELTQAWSPELAALNDKAGGLLTGIPLLVGGELKTFSLPKPLDDDGTDISLKDWHLGPRKTSSLEREGAAAPYSIKPFKGSMRTRFTPMEPRLDEDLSPRAGQSSPDQYETPTTPRTSSSGTRSSSASPKSTFRQEGDSALLATLTHGGDQASTPTTNGSESSFSSLQNEDSDDPHDNVHHGSSTVTTSPPARAGGIAFDVIAVPDDRTLRSANADTNNKSARSVRVSFVEKATAQTPQRAGSGGGTPPVVRQRSPLKSRSLHPAKESKALQPKWESSTKIRHPIITSSGTTSPVTTTTKPAPKRGVRRARSASGAKPRASVAPLPMPAHEIEGDWQGSSGYFSEARTQHGSDRHLGQDSRRSLDSHSMGYSRGDYGEYSSTRLAQHLSRDLTMSPIHDSSALNSHPELARSFGRRQPGARDDDDDDNDEEDTKAAMMCGGGLSDIKLSGDFVRLLSKLCRVSVPSPKQSVAKSVPRKLQRSNTTTLSWDPSTSARESHPVIGRHDSLKLLSEKCSNAPTPTYDVNKPRKIRDHEPHIHFYKGISKTLDQKLKN